MTGRPRTQICNWPSPGNPSSAMAESLIRRGRRSGRILRFGSGTFQGTGTRADQPHLPTQEVLACPKQPSPRPLKPSDPRWTICWRRPTSTARNGCGGSSATSSRRSSAGGSTGSRRTTSRPRCSGATRASTRNWIRSCGSRPAGCGSRSSATTCWRGAATSCRSASRRGATCRPSKPIPAPPAAGGAKPTISLDRMAYRPSWWSGWRARVTAPCGPTLPTGWRG